MQIRPIKNYNKECETAADKSITHRAVMFNSVARGKAKVTNALLGGDCKSTIACMRALGAKIEVNGNTVTIEGSTALKNATLDTGNSGTTTRLLTGLLAGRGITVSIDGDDSLRTRPMQRVTRPLSEMGADIKTTDGKVPLYIYPSKLKGIDYKMPVASAQVKSAILLAALSADGRTSVTEEIKSRDHTELMLKAMGANIRINGLTTEVSASELKAIDVNVVGDISSAAYLLGIAAVVQNGCVRVNRVGLNPTRTGIIKVFERMGANIDIVNRYEEVEPYGDIILEHAPLKGVEITAEEIPSLIDEIPLIAAVACYAEGKTVISGAEELKVKESDRIKTTTAALRALGAEIEPTDDGMIIYGKGKLTGGGKVDAAGDHRIAMSAAVAAAGSELGGEIMGAETAAISYPNFWEEIC